MARFAVDKTLPSMTALFALVLFLGLMAYAVAAQVSLGGLLYVLALAAIILGFWTKEDVVAMLGIMGLCFLVILDIVYYIGLLG